MKYPLKSGTLLIATAPLLDPNFQRTVVLLCQHQEDAGTYGLTLNRPMETPDEVVDELPFLKGELFRGGPVQPEALQLLHPFPSCSRDSLEVLPGLWMGGDFEQIKRGFSDSIFSPERCRFFLGYAGWDGGQLKDECRTGSWICTDASMEFVLDTSPDKMWAEAIRLHGTNHSLYTNFPDDPKMN